MNYNCPIFPGRKDQFAVLILKFGNLKFKGLFFVGMFGLRLSNSILILLDNFKNYGTWQLFSWYDMVFIAHDICFNKFITKNASDFIITISNVQVNNWWRGSFLLLLSFLLSSLLLLLLLIFHYFKINIELSLAQEPNLKSSHTLKSDIIWISLYLILTIKFSDHFSSLLQVNCKWNGHRSKWWCHF